MTAKKDLKKAKSKKRANKSRPQYKGIETNKASVTKKYKNYEDAVNKNTKINIYSLCQTLTVLLVSLFTLFIKPGSKYGKELIAQNRFIRDNILIDPVLMVVGAILILGTIYMLYLATKEAEIRRFHVTGAMLTGIGAVVCLSDQMKTYPIYAFFVMTIIAVAILQAAKMPELSKLRAEYK